MSNIKFIQLPADPRSLAIAARFVSAYPPFAKFEFAEMMKTLFQQIDKKTHLVLSRDEELVGYLGWLRTTNEIADKWVKEDGPLRWKIGGTAVAVSVMCAEDSKDILSMIKEAKRIEPNASVYWKRYYQDGRENMGKAVVKRSAE